MRRGIIRFSMVGDGQHQDELCVRPRGATGPAAPASGPGYRTACRPGDSCSDGPRGAGWTASHGPGGSPGRTTPSTGGSRTRSIGAVGSPGRCSAGGGSTGRRPQFDRSGHPEDHLGDGNRASAESIWQHPQHRADSPLFRRLQHPKPWGSLHPKHPLQRGGSRREGRRIDRSGRPLGQTGNRNCSFAGPIWLTGDTGRKANERAVKDGVDLDDFSTQQTAASTIMASWAWSTPRMRWQDSCPVARRSGSRRTEGQWYGRRARKGR